MNYIRILYIVNDTDNTSLQFSGKKPHPCAKKEVYRPLASALTRANVFDQSRTLCQTLKNERQNLC
jgi:hypothetical protein